VWRTKACTSPQAALLPTIPPAQNRLRLIDALERESPKTAQLVLGESALEGLGQKQALA
jgi:hypothetical protein